MCVTWWGCQEREGVGVSVRAEQMADSAEQWRMLADHTVRKAETDWQESAGMSVCVCVINTTERDIFKSDSTCFYICINSRLLKR